MYKIYINGNEMLLASEDAIHKKKSSSKRIVAPYTGKTKMLLSYIDMLEKTDRFDRIILYHADPKFLLRELESLFTVVKAAGGVVEDENGNILMIFRRGHWDLPKGKQAAALREVEEETGVQGLELKKKLLTTRHTYKLKNGKRAIKKTYWYRMKAANQKLVPQTEEDITKAVWAEPTDGSGLTEPIYGNILDVLGQFQTVKKY